MARGEDRSSCLLSDPTKGVDIHARSEIYAALGDLAARGTAVLVFASDLRELLTCYDRILGHVRRPDRGRIGRCDDE